MTQASQPRGVEPSGSVPRRVAVVDIGATAIRMEIAEISPDRPPRTLESLSQPVRLGKDTFTTGALRRETIEESVRILQSYLDLIRQYQIPVPEGVRAIATSAVKEAANREAFLDRVHVATGLNVECAEDADLVRLTYLAVRGLPPHVYGRKSSALVVEVGGGNTELLLLQSGRVVFYETFPLGSVRLRQMLEASRLPIRQQRMALDDVLHRMILRITQSLQVSRVGTLIAISGDMRLMAERLTERWEDVPAAILQPSAVTRFAERVLTQTPDELVANYEVSFAEAETFGPALLAYARLARAFHVRRIVVPKVHLRTALEIEMAIREDLADELREHIRDAARQLADHYQADAAHAEHVAQLASRLFRTLAPVHRLGPRHEFLLEIAARLHEIGLYVSNRSHHKHSMYLILNSGLFGVRRDDLLTIALVARYHRRSPPKPEHPFYSTLSQAQRVVVQKLAAILRVADALDRSRRGRVADIEPKLEENRLVLLAPNMEDLTLEMMALREKGSFFEDLFGLRLDLRARPVHANGSTHEI